MRGPLCHVMFLILIRLGSFVNAAALSNKLSVPANIIQSPRLTNSTILTAIPDEFTLRGGQDYGVRLPLYRCLEAAISIIGNHLASQEPTERIQAQEWNQENAVFAVAVPGASSGSIERRFVIWALYVVFRDFADQKIYKCSVYALFWRGGFVGTLAIHPKGLTTTNTTLSSATMTNMELPVSLVPAGSDASVPLEPDNVEVNGVELVFHFLGLPKPLDLIGMLINIFGALCQAATFPGNKIVQPYSLQLGPSGVIIYISPTRIMNFKWLVAALTAVPQNKELMRIQDGFWAEVKVGALNLGGIHVLPQSPVSDTTNAFVDDSFDVSAGSATASERDLTVD